MSKPMFKFSLTLSVSLLALSLSACNLAPSDSGKPTFTMGSLWPFADSSGATGTDAAQTEKVADWWSHYNDPALSQLVTEGLKANEDLLLAASRVAQARARYGYATSNLFPEIDVQGQATRTGPPQGRTGSATVTSGTGAGGATGGTTTGTTGGSSTLSSSIAGVSSTPYNTFSLAGVLNYEIDLWGRLANASRSARAQLLSSEANREAVRLAVTAEVAQDYFNLRALDAQIAVTDDTIRSRQAAFDYQNKQFKAGQIDGLSFRQAQAELASAQASLPSLRQQRAEQLSALAVLLGRDPGAILEAKVEPGKPLDQLPIPPVIPAELPSQLLERRPDIQAAELSLEASNAEIGVARAAYFPTLSLTGLLGTSSDSTGDLFTHASRNWQVGATASGPVLDFGRTNANVDLAFANREEALSDYRSTVRNAFKETVDALNAQQNLDTQQQALAEQTRALSEQLRLAQVRYDAGYSDYLEVLDAQRSLYTAQLSGIDAQRARLANSATLYKALGGGWIVAAVPAAPSEAATEAAKPEPQLHDTGDAKPKR